MFYLPTSLYPRRIPSDVIPSRSPQETRLATGMSCRNEGWLYLQGTAFSETKETNLMSRRVFRILVGWWWHGIILPNILVYIHNLTTIHHRKLRAWSTAHLKWDILEKGWIQQHKWQLKGICCMICWTQIATVTGFVSDKMIAIKVLAWLANMWMKPARAVIHPDTIGRQ